MMSPEELARKVGTAVANDARLAARLSPTRIELALVVGEHVEAALRAERPSSEELDALREEVEAYREAFDAAAEEDGEGFLKRVAAAHQLTERAKISEELASLKAERNALHRELSNIIPRFEKALAVTGSDPEFIVEATRRHRAALHPAGSGREEG